LKIPGEDSSSHKSSRSRSRSRNRENAAVSPVTLIVPSEETPEGVFSSSEKLSSRKSRGRDRCRSKMRKSFYEDSDLPRSEVASSDDIDSDTKKFDFGKTSVTISVTQENTNQLASSLRAALSPSKGIHNEHRLSLTVSKKSPRRRPSQSMYEIASICDNSDRDGSSDGVDSSQNSLGTFSWLQTKMAGSPSTRQSYFLSPVSIASMRISATSVKSRCSPMSSPLSERENLSSPKDDPHTSAERTPEMSENYRPLDVVWIAMENGHIFSCSMNSIAEPKNSNLFSLFDRDLILYFLLDSPFFSLFSPLSFPQLAIVTSQ
jgi:hypothetical protein